MSDVEPARAPDRPIHRNGDAQDSSPSPASADDGRRADKESAIDAELLEDVQDELVRRVVMEMEQYSSPHPHPDHLERYAKLYPEAPKIVFDAFRDQGQHRREMETKYMHGSERRANIGQFLAFILVGAVIGAGFYAISQGQAAAGATIITVGFGGGVVLVVAGARQPSAGPVRKPKTSKRGRATTKQEIEPSSSTQADSTSEAAGGENA